MLKKYSRLIESIKLVEDTPGKRSIRQKIFTNDQDMQRHTVVKLFACDSCNKLFKGEKQIQMHIKRVHGEKTFECDLCGLKLKTKGALTIHNKRHLKQYVTECTICNVGFVTNQEYINHMGSKHGQSNHVCNVCGRSCYDKAALQGMLNPINFNHFSRCTNV